MRNSQQPRLPKDFIDFIQAMNAAQVEYVVVGGLALAFHGYVRATKDLDVFVKADRPNASKMLAALRDFGAPTKGVSEKDFSVAKTILQIGVAPVRIDVSTVIDGVTFEDASSEKIVVDFGGTPANVIGLRALIKNKRATARPQDLADIAALSQLTKTRNVKRKRRSR